MGFAGLDDARLALSAGKRFARVDALADTVNIFATNSVTRAVVVSSALVVGRFLLATDVGIARESVTTDARSPVSVGYANGVGSALLAGARVHATTKTAICDGLINGKANFSAGAVKIVSTRWNGAQTSSAGGVTRKAYALAVSTTSVRSTTNRRAWIGDRWLDGRFDTDGHAHHERIARESFLTLAIVASGGIETNGIGSASVTHTFVHIFASHVRVALVTNWADTIDSIDSLTTFRIDTAFGCVTGLLLSAARFVRIARRTGVANAPIRLAVFAVRVATARWLTDRRDDWRNAEQIRFADEIGQTDALVGGLVATSSNSARDAFAALLAASGNADLRVLTR